MRYEAAHLDLAPDGATVSLDRLLYGEDHSPAHEAAFRRSFDVLDAKVFYFHGAYPSADDATMPPTESGRNTLLADTLTDVVSGIAIMFFVIGAGLFFGGLI